MRYFCFHNHYVGILCRYGIEHFRRWIFSRKLTLQYYNTLQLLRFVAFLSYWVSKYIIRLPTGRAGRQSNHLNRSLDTKPAVVVA